LNKEKAQILGHSLNTAMIKYTKSNRVIYLDWNPSSIEGKVLQSSDFWSGVSDVSAANTDALAHRVREWLYLKCQNECLEGTPVIIVVGSSAEQDVARYQKLADKYGYALKPAN
jgi:hypothetical protein